MTNHAVCRPCWRKDHSDGRPPVTLLDGEIEFCCRCGALTAAGIFVRGAREEYPCCGCDD